MLPGPRAPCLLLALPLLLAVLPDHGPSTQQQDRQRQDKTAPYPRHGKYIGMAECEVCHEVQVQALAKGHHRGVVKDHTLQQCETCHGPGAAHATDEDNNEALITFPPALSRDRQITLCGRCHQEQIENHGGDLAGFFAIGKTCTSCHKVHEKIPKPPHPGVHFHRRTDAAGHAKEVGAKKCTTCHPLRDRLLQRSYHRSMATTSTETGCETCHGEGSLHVETNGLGRLITRPDRAQDGRATCRSCHPHVDPVEFHWQGKKKPLLSSNMTCTTCHQIHKPVLQKLGGVPIGSPPTAMLLHGYTPPGVTNRVCMKCHAPAFEILKGTIHETVGRPDTPLQQGCGACHDGARQHAENAGRRHLVESLHDSDAATQMRTCNKCHGKDQALRHVKIGSHQRRKVSCLSCHSPAARRDRVRADAEKNCAGCHQAVAADFRRPHHHPVDVRPKDPDKPKLGKMGCTHCHDPHAARPKIRDRKLKFETCVSCHKKYRGPFVFAHQASRSDHCVACHTPHGASNRRLLKQHNTQQNCLQCHGDFPAFHDQTRGAVFTNCLRCHTQVHGSNHSRFLFR